MKNPNVYQKKFRFSFIVCIVQERDFTEMKNRFDGFIQDSLPRLLYGIP